MSRHQASLCSASCPFVTKIDEQQALHKWYHHRKHLWSNHISHILVLIGSHICVQTVLSIPHHLPDNWMHSLPSASQNRLHTSSLEDEVFSCANRLLSCAMTLSILFCEALALSVPLMSVAPALNARMMRQATKRICAMNMPTDTPKLKSVPEWFEQKMLKNDTKFQAQSERANFCSFPIENVKGAQVETTYKFKLSKNMWLQTSNRHIPNSWAPRQQDAEEIDDEAMEEQKDKGT